MELAFDSQICVVSEHPTFQFFLGTHVGVFYLRTYQQAAASRRAGDLWKTQIRFEHFVHPGNHKKQMLRIYIQLCKTQSFQLQM